MTPSAAFLAATMAWASATAGLPAAPAPRVVVAATARDGTTLGRVAAPGVGAAAMTYPGGIVYLAPGWDERNILDQAILAHELVHVMQFAAGYRYRCVAEMEPLAWFVEAYYLRQHGVDLWTAKIPAAVFAMARAAPACPNK